MTKARILLIEDNRFQAMATKEFMETKRYEVNWVENGKSAIIKANSQPVRQL